MVDGEGIIFPRRVGFDASDKDFTQVVVHQLSCGGFRRDKPYSPPPKPVTVDTGLPNIHAQVAACTSFVGG